MTRGNGAHVAHDTRIRAVERVDGASAEQSRLRDEYQRAKGTDDELKADASVQAANDEVAARKRWLEWVDEGDY